MKANELITLIQENNKDVSTINELNDIIDKALSAEETTEVAEETSEEAEEETEEETSEEETTEEESAEEETPEEEAGEPEADTNLSAVMGILNDLRADNERLREENQNLTAQLATKNKTEKEFIEKFKNLSVSIREDEKPAEKKHHQLGMTNGIGEL